jgi:hypothetical protein
MDMVWSSMLVNAAELAFLLDDRAAAAALFELLSPHANTIAWNGVVLWGSVEGYLGLLATTLGHYDGAVAHFEAAARVHERVDAPIFLAANRVGWATALLRRGDPHDGPRIQLLLEQAREAASLSGAAAIADRADELLARAARTG